MVLAAVVEVEVILMAAAEAVALAALAAVEAAAVKVAEAVALAALAAVEAVATRIGLTKFKNLFLATDLYRA